MSQNGVLPLLDGPSRFRPDAPSAPETSVAETPTVDLDTIATHECGHAVMHWLRGLPATYVTADENGGFCAGTGKPIRPQDMLFVVLAGFAAECGCGLFEVDLTASRADDFDKARRLLSECDWMRMRLAQGEKEGVLIVSVEEALSDYFKRACDLLQPYQDFIERMALRLARKGRLSARSVAAMLREYGKELKRENEQLADSPTEATACQGVVPCGAVVLNRE